MSTKHILEVANSIGLNKDDILMYGNSTAKIVSPFETNTNKSKLVLVTAITPTSAGEGKTTMAIALHDALWDKGVKSLLCLREPSLGPVFGIKGGATGGGKAKLFPSDDINLHFTGDYHALTSSINLISAVIENHIYQGNALDFDIKRIAWKRALDINDRSLRNVIVSRGKGNGIPHNSEFQITVASELMAILCLATDKEDFKKRLNQCVIGYSNSGNIIKLEQLNVDFAILKLMEYALLPNLVQTLNGNPVLVHGGPFANIAHGCNSLIATRYALSKAPIVITEAGFASDLGAEKFYDIKCRTGNLDLDLAIVVASVKALKLHGGVNETSLKQENPEAVISGFANLEQHVENMKYFGVNVLIVLNKYNDDAVSELNAFKKECEKRGYDYAFDTSVIEGKKGGSSFAAKVLELLNKDSSFRYLYDLSDTIKEKIEKIAKNIYHADGVKYSKKAEQQLKEIIQNGYQELPVCMAKTPASFSDNPALKNAPRGFKITIREFSLKAGAGFVVALTGKVLTMPGLPLVPAAVNMKEVR